MLFHYRETLPKRELRVNLSKPHLNLYEWITVQYDSVYNSHYPFEIEVQWKSVSGCVAFLFSSFLCPSSYLLIYHFDLVGH